MRSIVVGLVAVAFAHAAGVSAATHEVQVVDFAFQPRTITIAAGDTVIWRNSRGIHNVASDDGTFRSGSPREAPWEFSHVFTAAGDHRYYCEPHGGPGGSGIGGRGPGRGAAGRDIRDQ